MAKDSSSRNTRVFKIYRILTAHFGPQHWWPARTPLEVIVGAVLTQNTAWSNVERAIGNLKQAGLLSMKRLLENRRRVPGLIRPSGYYRIKTRRLLNLLDFIARRYRGKLSLMKAVPTGRLRDELLAVNGVGFETADSILLYALNKRAFVVDAYTRRIFTRHGFLKGDESYGEIQDLLVRSLPRSTKLYNEYHALIVRLAKTNCFKHDPDCATCPISRIS